MKRQLIKIIISLLIFISAYLVKNDTLASVLFIASYILVGYRVIIKAAKNISHGKIFDENFLMMIATFGAFVIREYPEAAAVMLFYQVGELFEKYAVSKSRKSISDLMNIRPDYANLVTESGIEKVSPEQVCVGDTILVRTGEKIPLDGTVISGSTSINMSALTGESLPVDVCSGSSVMSGSVNGSGLIEIRVTKPFAQSTVSKILELVESSSAKKSHSENFITRFAAVYTPAVVISALLLAVIPPLLFSGQPTTWIYRALNFLVVSCPCALVISVPLSFFGGIGAASKIGVLIKGSNYLEAISKADTVVFDKTGTLTKGEFEISSIHSQGIGDEELLKTAAYAEYYSNHPLSAAIKKAFSHYVDENAISDYTELSGLGVHVCINGCSVFAGNEKLMRQEGITPSPACSTVIHIARDNDYLGYIELADAVKPDSYSALSELKALGIKKLVMLTGDNKASADKAAKALGITDVYSGLLPADKVKCVEEMIKNQSPSSKLVFTGDGINDAPVLTLADVGIAMGQIGQDAAIEAADIVIMTDETTKIADTIKISKKTLKIVHQNIVFALFVKFLILILCAIGAAGMWAAVFADVGVSVIAILNSMRTMKTKKTIYK